MPISFPYAHNLKHWILIVSVALACQLTLHAESLLLWPDGPAGQNKTNSVRSETAAMGDRLVGGKKILRVSNVTEPSITVYRPPARKATGTAILVCPGGGYGILAMDLEGTEVCEWLNLIGVTAILLKYRVPPVKGVEPWEAPLQDAQRALSLIRFHATEWQINSNKVGMLGFSAGGHLSALTSTHFKERSYPVKEPVDSINCRPDFTLLIYPGRLVQNDNRTLSPELIVTSNTPPTFLVQTQDDPIHVENSLVYYSALTQVHVPTELHLYAEGGHGYGLRKTTSAVTAWPKMAEDWIRQLGFLNN